LQFKGREAEDICVEEEMTVIFGAGGPGKSDSSAANSEPGPNPESRIQDPEPAKLPNSGPGRLPTVLPGPVVSSTG